MDHTETYNQLVEDFNLTPLPEEDREEMLLTISKAIQKQFLLNIFDVLGQEKFDALLASVNMGEEFYTTTLKHLVPGYEDMFQESRKKVITVFKGTK